MLALLRFALKASPRAAAMVAVMSLSSAAAALATTVVAGQMVGAIPDFIRSNPNNVWATVPGLSVLTAVLVLAFTLDGVLTVLISVAARKLVYDSDVLIYRAVTSVMVESPRTAHLESPAVLDESRRAQRLGNQAIWVGLVPLGELARSRLLVAGSASIVAVLVSSQIAVLLTFSTLLVEWWSTRMAKIESKALQAQTQVMRTAEYSWELGMGVAAKELRVFGFAPWLRDRFMQDWLRAMLPVWKARRKSIRLTILVYVVHVAALAVAIWFIASQVNEGVFGVANTATALAALLRLALSANGASAVAVERGLTALRSFYKLPRIAADVRASVRDGPSSGPTTLEAASRPLRKLRRGSIAPPVLSDPPRPSIGLPEVRFENVWFRYPGSQTDVLRGLQLEIRAGEAVGLVGMNGAGKSTLVHLLGGAYPPTRGRILADGVNLATMDDEELAAWQRRLAPVPQEFLRLPLTAAENVMLAERVDFERLSRVAEIAGLSDVISRLPRRWETVMDRSVTDGGELSGGEWQRLALARALYAVESGAGLLVLDEPAAMLDVRSEAELVNRYLRLTAGVTSLTISHRFSVVRNAHRICVLENGYISEQGSHDDLVSNRGRYSEMFMLQATQYLKSNSGRAGARDIDA